MTVPAIYKKWTNAVKQVKNAQDDFDGLCDAVGKESTTQWIKLEKELQSQRADDITVMDSFDVSNDEGTFYLPSLSQLLIIASRARKDCTDQPIDTQRA